MICSAVLANRSAVFSNYNICQSVSQVSQSDLSSSYEEGKYAKELPTEVKPKLLYQSEARPYGTAILKCEKFSVKTYSENRCAVKTLYFIPFKEKKI